MKKKYLLDTHFLIWVMNTPKNISKKTIEIIKNKGNKVFVSQVSLWEIAIKQKIGKLEFLDSLESFKEDIENAGFEYLRIDDAHIFETLKIELKSEHKDPFDRLLIAQAKTENLVLITDDQKFKLYNEIEIII